MRPSCRTRVGLSIVIDPQCIALDGLTNAAERKLRIHPKEDGHSIEDLPSLSQSAGSDELSAAEILKSLGLEVGVVDGYAVRSSAMPLSCGRTKFG